MNKMGIVDAVSTKVGATKKMAEEAVDTVFETIMHELGKGEEVSIAGFGSFLAKKRPARMGVNPRTGEKIQIKATTTPKFRAGKALKMAVK
ncbi:MAG: HU family DNA-binding protein [bacterium]|nr:HU family DNA-binding protein [bacterium]